VSESELSRRQVYVRRRGRMTRGQARALSELREQFCIDPQHTQFVSNSKPVGVEIGFGMGQATLAWAQQRPDWKLFGIEVYEPGIGALMLQLEQASLDNLRIIEADARTLFEDWLPPESIDQINIFFPDPWPKKRHASRRIIQPDTLALFASRLKQAGSLRLATDWQPYAQWMLECGNAEPRLMNMAADGNFADRPAERPVTRFEQRGLRLGHGVWDLCYTKCADEVLVPSSPRNPP